MKNEWMWAPYLAQKYKEEQLEIKLPPRHGKAWEMELRMRGAVSPLRRCGASSPVGGAKDGGEGCGTEAGVG